MVDWFMKQRQAWIKETLHVYGFVNRIHICRKFQVSIPQASMDLRDFQLANPELIVYNRWRKRYEAAFAGDILNGVDNV